MTKPKLFSVRIDCVIEATDLPTAKRFIDRFMTNAEEPVNLGDACACVGAWRYGTYFTQIELDEAKHHFPDYEPQEDNDEE